VCVYYTENQEYYIHVSKTVLSQLRDSRSQRIDPNLPLTYYSVGKTRVPVIYTYLVLNYCTVGTARSRLWFPNDPSRLTFHLSDFVQQGDLST
jgi:hypothetical protein